MKCPLVRIEWLDSAQPISAWKYLSHYRDNPCQPYKCVSVGWMIRDDDVMKALVQNFADVDTIDPERHLQVSGVIRIPTCCVVRISRLDEHGDKLLFPCPETTDES